MENNREIIIVSACLVGAPVRYDGQTKKNNDVLRLLDYYDVIPVCPETDGGLKTPRAPSELNEERRAINIKESDVTDFYNRGISLTLEIVKRFNVKLAVLKDRSPSCGVKKIHNGKFDGGVINGNGLLTEALLKAGVTVISENEVPNLLSSLNR